MEPADEMEESVSIEMLLAKDCSQSGRHTPCAVTLGNEPYPKIRAKFDVKVCEQRFHNHLLEILAAKTEDETETEAFTF
jgi:hypothetical protein